MCIRDREKTLYGFYGMPGNDYIESLTDAQFTTFMNGEWRQYVTHVVGAIAAQPAGAVRALQIWNEPDGTPTGVNPLRAGYGKIATRVGALIGNAKGLWMAGGLRPAVPLMIGVGGPVTMLTWAVANLDPLERRFLKNNVTWFGFHPA